MHDDDDDDGQCDCVAWVHLTKFKYYTHNTHMNLKSPTM